VFVEKRHAIIESATRLFGSIGFDATTTLEIADEADVTEPLINYHFKGKHELGIFLRNHFQASKVQFERNVYFFFKEKKTIRNVKLTSQYFLRKWIDYSVLSS